MKRFDPLSFVKNKFLRDTATLQVSSVITKIAQVVSSVALAYLLGATGQGRYFLAIGLQGLLFNLINVGVLQAAIVQIASAATRDNRSKVAQWLAFLIKAYLIVNVAIIVVAYFLLPPVAEKWYSHRELGVWAFYLCFFPFLDTARVAVLAALQGTRRMLLVAQLDNSTEIMRVFLVIAGAIYTGSPFGAILGEIVSRALWCPIALSLYRAARKDGGGYLPSIREVLAEVQAVPFRTGMRLAVRVGFVKNTHTMFVNVIPGLVLGGLAGAEWVTWFNVAKRFIDLPTMMLQGVTRTASPALAEAAGRREPERFRKLFGRITLLGGGIVSLGVLAFLPLVKPLTVLFYPHDYADPVFEYAAIMALGYVLAGGLVAIEPFYIVTNQMKKSLTLTAIGALITVPANVALMIWLPRTGVAWGQTVYLSWAFAHYAYVWWYFKSGHYRTIWTEVPVASGGGFSPTGPSGSP